MLSGRAHLRPHTVARPANTHVCFFACVYVCCICVHLSCCCALQVRALAKAKAAPGEILASCDRVRDDTLPDLGVRLEDRPDGEEAL